MYTTAQAIKILLNKPFGLSLIMKNNPNIHIFKCVEGEIYKGEYGDGATIKFNPENYKDEIWIIDFKGSRLENLKIHLE